MDITPDKLKQLFQLQIYESDIRRLEREVADLTTKREAISDRMVSAEAAYQAQLDLVEGFKKQYRGMEFEIEGREEKIKDGNDKLMSVNSNKEYQAVLKGLDELKTAISEYEDRMLACLDDTDAAEKKLAGLEKEREHARKLVDADKVTLAADQKAREKQIERYREESAGLNARIDDNLMTCFTQTKLLQPDKVGITRAVDGVCGGCNLHMPPQFYNEMTKNDELRYCPHCQRILYWEEI